MHKLLTAQFLPVTLLVCLCIFLTGQIMSAEDDTGINKIAFASTQNGSDNLVVIDPVTKQEQTQVIPESLFWGFPDWSPNCDRLALDRFQGNLKEVNVVGYSSEGISYDVKPIGPIEIVAYQPHWSPDGNSLLFQGLDMNPEHQRGTFEIYILSTVTGSVTNLSKDDVQDAYPDWSPNGKQVVYAAIPRKDNPKEYFDIYMVNADGSSVKPLYTDVQTDDFAPLWSPDGTGIAFVSRSDNGDRLLLLKTDGSVTSLTGDTLYKLGHFSWSNDSQYIAFTYDRTNDDYQILLLNMNTLSIEPLTDVPHTINEFASWSPDDSQIAFQSNHDGDFEIYTMDVKTKIVTQLTDNNVDDQYPSWSPRTCLSNN